MEPLLHSQLTAGPLVQHEMIQQTGMDLRGENVVDVTDEPVPAGELLVPVPLKLLELVPLNLELVLYLRRLRSLLQLRHLLNLFVYPAPIRPARSRRRYRRVMLRSLVLKPPRHAVTRRRVHKLPIRARRRNILSHHAAVAAHLVVGHLHLRLGLHEPPAVLKEPLTRLLPSRRFLPHLPGPVLRSDFLLAPAHDVHPRVRLVLNLW